MGWSVEIRRASVPLTIDANVSWKWNADFTPTAGNQVGSIDHRIEIEGELEDTDPSVIGETFFEYLHQVSQNFEPVEVAILQDGEEREVLTIEDGFIGPFVSNFRSGAGSDDGGEGESKMSYAFTIIYRSKGGQSESNKDVDDLSTSIETTSRNGKIVRKVWKVSLSSTTAASAENAAKSFKPTEKFITEQITVISGVAIRAEGVWVWESEAAGVVQWKCKVTYTGGVGFGYLTSADPKIPPTRFILAAEPIRIDVEGEIVAFTPEIVLPADHFSESEDIVRVPRLERFQRGTQIHDRERGEYRREYHEVYECTGTVPEPTHSGSHHLIDAGHEPGDGKAGR